jgi:hypothetical protein
LHARALGVEVVALEDDESARGGVMTNVVRVLVGNNSRPAVT